MNTSNSSADAPRKLQTATQALLRHLGGPAALVLAVGLSIVVGLNAPDLARSLAPIGNAYLALLKMVLLPFLLAAMLCSVTRIFRTPHAHAYLRGLLVVYPAGLLLAACIGLGWALALQPGALTSSSAGNVLGQIVDATSERYSTDLEIALVPKKAQELSDPAPLAAVIPSNIFAALGAGDTLQVLVFCVLFGLAMGRSSVGRGELLGMLEGVYRTCQTFVHWLGYLLPLGLFALLSAHIADSGLAPLVAMGSFVLAQSLGALTLALVAVAVLVWKARVPAMAALGALGQTVVLAVATRSSIACIPAAIEALVVRLKLPRVGVELLMPLGVTLFRFGPALYFALCAAFVAQLYSRPLGAQEMALIVGAASLAAVASSGTTGVLSLSLLSIVCVPLRLPFEAALVLFVAVDALMDPLRTLGIVLGNCAACSWVAAGGAPAAADSAAQAEGDVQPV
jgi:Na+/H+-dicarboxylate symporter